MPMRLLITLGREGSPKLAGRVSCCHLGIWFIKASHLLPWLLILNRSRNWEQISKLIYCPWNRMFIPVWNIEFPICVYKLFFLHFFSRYQSLLLCAWFSSFPSVCRLSSLSVISSIYFSLSLRKSWVTFCHKGFKRRNCKLPSLSTTSSKISSFCLMLSKYERSSFSPEAIESPTFIISEDAAGCPKIQWTT